MEEQEGDVVRQQRMQYLAAEADKRWEAKPKTMEAPREEAAAPVLESGGVAEDAPVGQESRVRRRKVKEQWKEGDKNDPWAKAKAEGPSEKWQPAAWDPSKKA